MNSPHFLAFSVAIGLSSLASAQATFPKGLQTTESTSDVPFIGGLPNSRFQIGHGDQNGSGLIFMKEMSFRQDGQRTGVLSAVARSWADVTVQLGETTVSSMTATFATNYLLNPTKVFGGKHSWPDLTKQPAGMPNPWGNGGLKFPFTTTFIYSGANDMLFDIVFTGGVLANNSPWQWQQSYYLDGRSNYPSLQGRLDSFGVTTPCTFDSAIPSTHPFGGGFGYTVVYSELQTNQFRYQSHRQNMPPNTTFLQGIGLGGTTSTTVPGPIPGLGCQSLMIDPALFFHTEFQKTDSAGVYDSLPAYTPFLPAIVGVEIWNQGAWDDTVTSAPHLTTTSRCKVPALPPAFDFVGKIVTSDSNSAPIGFGPGDSNVPVIRVQ